MTEENPQRKHPLAKCEECPLYLEPGPVLGIGPEGAVRVAVVGEAPGFQEATVGRPFVGPSGQVLNEVLRNNEIDRKGVFVTNAVACRPPKNATPPPEAIEACKPRLMAEIAEHAPEYIVAAGAVGARAMGLKGAMKNLRVGPPRAHELEIVNEETGESLVIESLVVPTWHPAYAIRLTDMLPTIDFDISKINKGADALTYVEPTLTIVDDAERAHDALMDLFEMPGPFAVDIETGIDKDDADIHADQRPLLCVGICYEPGKVVVFGKNLMSDQSFLDHLGILLYEKELIMHNGKSDVAGLMPVMGPVNLRYDTMLEHYVLDERTGGHSLGVLGIELLGTPDWKSWTKPYLAKGAAKNFADIPPHVLYRYNAVDCDVTYRLHFMFWSQIEGQGRTQAHDHMIKAANQLVYPEMDGIAFDMPYSLELTEDLQSQIAEVESDMASLLGKKVNPRSTQQLIALFDERGWHVPTSTKNKSGRGTGAKELEIARVEGRYDEHPDALKFLDLLMQARDLSKDDGTYCRGMQIRAVDHGDHHRIHTTYTLHVATTGRLSSKDPNLQNIKNKPYLRRQFVARPGNIFLSGDYSQVEGRVIAVLSDDPYLQSLFLNTERDIFDEISQAMYGQVIKAKRTLLKSFFYGLSYGRTAHGIAGDPNFNLTFAEADQQLEAFKELIPGVLDWQEKTWQTVQDQGYLETTFGRRRHFPLITNRNKDEVRKEALAFIPQSTASDICLRAFYRLRPALEERYGDTVRIRLTIHDAIVLECPIEMADEVSFFMSLYMTYSGDEWAKEQNSEVPFQVAFKRGASWDQLD